MSLRVTFSPDFEAAGFGQRYTEMLAPCYDRLQTVYGVRNTSSAYANSDGFINVAYDDAIHEQIKTCVAQKRKLPIDTLIIVGIGGSSLGARALCELFHANYAQKLRIIFAESFDPVQWVQEVGCAPERTLVNVVSKSGNTLETVVLLERWLAVLQKQHRERAADFLVVTTDFGSPLDTWAQKFGCAVLHIPGSIGGRWSVLSPVALLAVAMAGLDIDDLCAGARLCVDEYMRDWQHHGSFLTACFVAEQLRRGNFLWDLFVFGAPLNALGLWQRQLIGESLGKRYRAPFTTNLVPTVSVGTSDLHSIVQLYLGGVIAQQTTFVTIAQWEPSEQCHATTHLLPAINGKSYAQLLAILFESVRFAYEQQGKPYVHIALDHCDVQSVGYYLQMCMIQTVLLAEIVGVNAYDQPQVELYKAQARRLLAQ